MPTLKLEELSSGLAVQIEIARAAEELRYLLTILPWWRLLERSRIRGQIDALHLAAQMISRRVA